MGSNSRYDMSRRRKIMEEDAAPPSAPLPSADSLTAAELNFQNDEPRKPRSPIPVFVWVHVAGAPVRLDGECVEFTSRAALVRYSTPGNTVEQVWVWANAVARR